MTGIYTLAALVFTKPVKRDVLLNGKLCKAVIYLSRIMVLAQWRVSAYHLTQWALQIIINN